LVAALALGVCRAQESPATFGTTVVIPSGLRGDIYFLPSDTYQLPDFRNLEPVGTIWTDTLNVSPRHWRDGFPGVTKRNEWFAIDYTGRFWIQKPGPYKLALMSDDGSKLYIDNQVVIDNDCQHSALARAALVTLSGGIHRIRVSYFQGPRDCLALVLAVAGPEEHWRVFSAEEFKPPSNPQDWTYGDPSELKVAPNPDAGRTSLRDLLNREPKKAGAGPARTQRSPPRPCELYPPVPRCQ
jgi:hypothetical protein